MKKKDLIGQVFGRLTVIAEADSIVSSSGNNRTAWLCECSCKDKTQKVIKADHLIQETTKSCGCLNDEKRSERAANMYGAITKYSPTEASARRIFRTQYADGDLTYEEFYTFSQQNCFYCGSAPSNTANCFKGSAQASKASIANGNFTYSGLDRLDNTKPHNKDNLVPCCKHCNYAKRDRTSEEFDSWITALYNNRIKS